jgi:hypothetical protein
LAASEGHSEVVERLIAARATVDAADKVFPRTRLTALCPITVSPHRINPWDRGGLIRFRRVSLAAPAPPPRQCQLPEYIYE